MIRHSLMIVCISLISWNTQAQEESRTDPYNYSTVKMNRLTVGLEFASNYSYRTLKPDENDATAVWVADMRNEREKPIIGFSTGISAFYSFGFRLSFQASVQYGRYGEQAETPITDQFGTSQIGLADHNYYYEYVQLPATIGYVFPLGNRLRLHAQAGIQTQFFARYLVKTIRTYTDESPTETSTSSTTKGSFNRVTGSWIGSVGIEFDAADQLSLRLDPTFCYFFKRIVDGSISQYPYSAGLNVGVHYRLK